ncbi:MAG: hypothetical protein LCI02_05085 [Proteobacteria bacterium]|nr:hypothetical protein [Pseudomonadota bacterium]
MIPTIGRDVILHGHHANGSLNHPAKITRVWSANTDTANGPVCVNLIVFGDNEVPHVRTSVMLYESRDEAFAACAGVMGGCAAHWPVRA